MKKKSALKNRFYQKYRDISKTINTRYHLLIIIISILLLILLINLFYVQIIKNKYYNEQLIKLTKNIVEGDTAPRGRIYDRNYKLIVDNKPVKVIYYKKKNSVTTDEEIKLAYFLTENLEINYSKLTDSMLRKFWLKNNSSKAKEKITSDEYQLLKERKLTSSDIEKLKLERITIEELNEYEEIDKKLHIYII